MQSCIQNLCGIAIIFFKDHFHVLSFIHHSFDKKTGAQEIDLPPAEWLHSSVDGKYCTGTAEVMGSNPVEAS